MEWLYVAIIVALIVVPELLVMPLHAACTVIKSRLSSRRQVDQDEGGE